MFEYLPPKKKSKAIKLFKYITKYNIFHVNENGEIIKKGKTLRNSNIEELITHAVNGISSFPVGVEYFYKTLKKKNIPDRYISNKNGRKIMDKNGRKIMDKSFQNETSRWRPPGRLNKQT